MLLITDAILLLVKLKFYGNGNTIFERKEISIVSGLGFIFWLQQTNVENILIEPQHSTVRQVSVKISFLAPTLICIELLIGL